MLLCSSRAPRSNRAFTLPANEGAQPQPFDASSPGMLLAGSDGTDRAHGPILSRYHSSSRAKRRSLIGGTSPRASNSHLVCASAASPLHLCPASSVSLSSCTLLSRRETPKRYCRSCLTASSNPGRSDAGRGHILLQTPWSCREAHCSLARSLQ